jgi:small-conductance mechanosensitive channel
MNDLMLILLGWLGYLERPLVVLQLGIIGAAMLTASVLGPRWTVLPRQLSQAIGLGGLALGCLLLGLLGLPSGLVSLLGLLALGWFSLDLLLQALARWLPQEQLRQLDSHLIRPTFLVIAALLLVSEVDSLASLSVIDLGRFLGVSVTVGKLLSALLGTYLLLAGSKPPALVLAWLAQRMLRISDSSRRALVLMLRYGMVGLGLLVVAEHLGLNTTALIAVAGGLSVGLGFGVKEVFSNFVSGLWLLFEGSVRPGEVLMIDGDACEVRHLGLRATVLWRDRDNAELLIPNQSFFTQQATSYTSTDRLRRSELLVDAPCDQDPARVIALLEATALEVEEVLRQPEPQALMLSRDDNAHHYALRYWIARPLENGRIASRVHQAIWHAFDREAL